MNTLTPVLSGQAEAKPTLSFAGSTELRAYIEQSFSTLKLPVPILETVTFVRCAKSVE